MDSEDDMHDANDLESLDDFYSGETAMASDEDDSDYEFIDNDSDDSEDRKLNRNQQYYTIMSESDICQSQEEDITRISTVLSISRVSASILLRHCNWSVSKVHDAWFADEDKVRKAVGLLEKPVVVLNPNAREFSCGICFETCPPESMTAAVCGHQFCKTCWTGFFLNPRFQYQEAFEYSDSIRSGVTKVIERLAPNVTFAIEATREIAQFRGKIGRFGDLTAQTAVGIMNPGYISTSISDGPGCLMLRCPDPSCRAAVGQDMINILASAEDNEKYARYLLRSYIEDNRKTKWCPAPGCEYAVDFVVGSGSYDVTCNCSYNFCFNCTEEAHRPVDCDTVDKWKKSAESENMNWILANSKPCPKCKRPIEKNQGCMRITCTPPCKFQFCWLCLGSWSDHGVGGFYACNRYETAKQEGAYDETERRREMAKNSLERYTHYYERWATNQLLEKLSDKQCQPGSQLKFITDAWLQIVECRRVLKWTYAYGYYLPKQEQAKRQFFEFLQGEAESGLERLHQCAVKELLVYLDAEGPSKDFNEFRTKLAGLTSVTRNYFENLVRALENGLSDVDAQGACSRTARLGTKQKFDRQRLFHMAVIQPDISDRPKSG